MQQNVSSQNGGRSLHTMSFLPLIIGNLCARQSLQETAISASFASQQKICKFTIAGIQPVAPSSNI